MKTVVYRQTRVVIFPVGRLYRWRVLSRWDDGTEFARGTAPRHHLAREQAREAAEQINKPSHEQNHISH